MEKINANFLGELFRKMFLNKDMMSIVDRYLDFKFIPKEEVGYKFVLKEARDQFHKYDKVPSLGVIAQKYNDNESVQIAVQQIKESEVVDDEVLLNQLESYIKDSEFLLLNKEIVDLYGEGKKDEAMRVSREESARITEFSLRAQSGMFLGVFSDFDRCRADWVEKKEKDPPVEFGIDALDDKYGGIDVGDTELWLARSGVGKSTVLRWRGMSTALLGHDVLHIQCEEAKEKVHMKYAQMWTYKTYSDLKEGDFTKEELDGFYDVIDQVKHFGADIKVYSFKKFGDATIGDVRSICIEYKKLVGKFPRLLIIDSFNLIRTGIPSFDNDPKPKYRFQECGKRLKNMCEEFGMSCATAIQTGDVPFEVWNDEEKVIDRSYAEGDRTVVQPFSWVFSINQTLEEVKNKTCRIFKDKVRDYENVDPVFKIATNYNTGRFYDRPRTMNEFYNLKITHVQGGGRKKGSGEQKGRVL